MYKSKTSINIAFPILHLVLSLYDENESLSMENTFYRKIYSLRFRGNIILVVLLVMFFFLYFLTTTWTNRSEKFEVLSKWGFKRLKIKFMIYSWSFILEYSLWGYFLPYSVYIEIIIIIIIVKTGALKKIRSINS